MPRTWRPPENKPMTPLASLLWQYLRANDRGIYTPADLAREVGTWHNTILNWFNGRSVPSVVMLQRIHEVTGIPLQQLSTAAGGSRRQPAQHMQPAPLPQPAPRPLPVQQQPAPLSAFDEAVRRIQATEHPAVAEVLIRALYATAGRTDPRDFWKTKIEEWKREEHDHDFIETLQLPAIPSPAETRDADPSQEESRPAGSRT